MQQKLRCLNITKLNINIHTLQYIEPVLINEVSKYGMNTRQKKKIGELFFGRFVCIHDDLF
jgi:hypothetical protein